LVGRWTLGHRFNVAFLLGLLIGIGFLTVKAYFKDREDEGYVAAVKQADLAAERVPELVEAYGIGFEGAAQLVRDDPFLQGPRLFARHCAACHRYNEHDGTGRELFEERDQKKVKVEPTAADLGNFGTKEWIVSLVSDYPMHFEALKNAAWYQELQREKQAQGEDFDKPFLDLDETEDTSTMAGWTAQSREILNSPEGREALEAVAAYIVANSGRADLQVSDATLVERGAELFDSADWPGGELADGISCSGCHTLEAGKPGPEPDEDGSGIPILTGYGGRRWLEHFISDPAKHYGEKNQMPAYNDRLSDKDLQLLTRWMSGEYHPTKVSRK
ncbi:MAG TPA: c-type cytochrome, partial [Planctomycetaceae bacterium]|nr:c-type cytochrome [Planctomycetaceae bacterium]